MICFNETHWFAHHDPATCLLQLCGSPRHLPEHHDVVGDPRLPTSCATCSSVHHHTVGHNNLAYGPSELLVRPCETCGEYGHLAAAHDHPCQAPACSEHASAAHQHDFQSLQHPGTCAEFLVPCNSLNHTAAAHRANDVEPLVCDICFSTDHDRGRHEQCMTQVHVGQQHGAIPCGHLGHGRGTSSQCPVPRDENRTPKEKLAEVFGADAANRTVKMAWKQFLRLREAAGPLTPEEALVEALIETVEDAGGRTTKLLWEASQFIDLLFKHCRDTATPYPNIDQTLLFHVFHAVAAPLQDGADGTVNNPLVQLVKTLIWDPLVASMPAGSYQRTSRRALAQILSYAANEYVTIAKNHVVTNLRSRVRTYTLANLRREAHTAGVFQQNLLGKGATTTITNYFVKVFADWDPREGNNANTRPAFSLPESELGQNIWAHAGMLAVCRKVFLHVRDDVLGMPARFLHPYWVTVNWQRFWSVLDGIQDWNELRRAEIVAATDGMSKAQRGDFFKAHPFGTKAVKAFDLLPKWSTKSKYIPIERASLHQLLREAQTRLGLDPITWAAYIAQERLDPDYWWNRFFRPNLVNTYRHGPLNDGQARSELLQRAFNYKVSTDGISCSISILVRDRPDAEPPADEWTAEKSLEMQALYPSKTHIGVDPGRGDLTVASRGNVFKDAEHVENSFAGRITNKEYYQVAGYTTETRKLNKRKRANGTIQQVENDTPSSQVHELADLLVYLRYVMPRLTTILGFYGTKKHRRSRLKRYIGRNKAYEELTDKFIRQTGARAVDLMVSFGAAIFRHNSRGSATSPGSTLGWLKSRLRRRGVTITPEIDEFLTSQTCPCCFARVAKNAPRNGHYKVKDCKNPNCLIKCWNRDVMAAANICHVANWMIWWGCRPLAYERQAVIDRLNAMLAGAQEDPDAMDVDA